ncbi:MAG: hypothetical protein OXM00_05375 [Paracoccaceae bacterium]|nr:hypothetical protein [Paracoccaceae bacterium]
MAEIEIINIKWEGPLTLEKAYNKNKKNDKGVYQVYGDHPVYGLDVLFYIGKTQGQTFGVRLKTHEKNFGEWDQRIQIYLGRIYAERKAWPSAQKWGSMIDRVERILIPACWPALNCQGIGGPSNSGEDEVKDLLILNWGRFRSLPATVSGRQAGIGSLDRNAQAIGSTKSS